MADSMPAKAGRKRTAKRTREPSGCQHSSITCESSGHASGAGYVRPSAHRRAHAQGIKAEEFDDQPHTFPAPLVLPDDDLAGPAAYAPQSVLAWTRERFRNKVTGRQNTIYIAGPPSLDPDVSFIETWSTHTTASGTSQRPSASEIVDIEHVAGFTRAFYHPLPVKVLPASTFKFSSWSSSDLAKVKHTPSSVTTSSDDERPLIGLQTPSEVIGIRTRPTPEADFPRQLNLDDLLDAAIGSLPNDAYALLMLVDQDLYEDEEDDFVCGRAYGGSRVAVVSTARYNPSLDHNLGLDLEHVWPLSHCLDYCQSFDPASEGGLKRPRNKKTAAAAKTKAVATIDTQKSGSEHGSNIVDGPTDPHHSMPLYSAVDATLRFRSSGTVESPLAVWLARVARTAVHELGHCFGIDHCRYYACVMQGSSSLKEDQRQPLYLCPVDLTKVLKATGASEVEHLRALSRFCQQHDDVEMFTALGAWVTARLKDLESEKTEQETMKRMTLRSSKVVHCLE